jgi:hypothetical protein
MNLGLSDMLKSEFKNYIPIERPVINTKIIADPYWIAGFVSVALKKEILMLILLDRHIK